MDALASGVTLAGGGIQVSKTAKECYRNYRDARKHIQYAQQQRQQLRLTLEDFEKLPVLKQERIAPAHTSLRNVCADLPTNIPSDRKRDRLRWIIGKKTKIEDEISQNSRVENSAMLNLLISLSQDMDKNASDSSLRHKELKSHLTYSTVVYTHGLISSSYTRERKVAYVRQWKWLLRALGLKLGFVISQNRSISAVLARWLISLPFGLSQLVTAQILFSSSFPSVRLGLRPQSIIAVDSDIVTACESGDIAKIRRILGSKQVHPNDSTSDDFTILRYAIFNGKSSAVQVLLDNGADPNLSFGIYETSPLDIAFRLGDPYIIRCLLRAGADLDYQNFRTWTALSYLWDPDRPAPSTTGEILEIYMSEGYSAWNEPDPNGWTPCHRAAAYGSSEDILSLYYKGGNMRAHTTNHLWGPMTCAVWNANQSTFDALMDLLELNEVLTFIDSSGWTLLHLAAENGNRHIIKTLLTKGADPGVMSLGAYGWVPQRLEGIRLTPEQVACEYGHGALWNSLMVS